MKLNKNVVFALPLFIVLTGCEILKPGGNAAEEIVFTEPEAIPQIQSTLKAGETLWEFSERTTGSGFNWEEIALLNDIKDERKVDAGLVLLVPPELAIDDLKNQ